MKNDSSTVPSSNKEVVGCRNLWGEVLKKAVKDARGKSNGPKEDAIKWFIDESFDIQSFLWVCCVLGYDVQAIRSSVINKDTGPSEEAIQAQAYQASFGTSVVTDGRPEMSL